jgi:regulator of replication initiation timing
MQTQDTASEICNLVDKNNDLIRRNEKLESLKKMFFEASEKQSVTISDYEGKITMLQEKKDKLEDLNKVYLRACTMHENELAGGRTEITTLKEENARLKATVARGGSSSDAKNLKTVNNNLMHQNAELSKENKELKQQHKEDAKKVKDSLKRVQDSTPSMKQVEEYKEYSKLAGQRLHQCKHDYNRMRMLKEDVEKELNDAKKAGADKTLAKTLKNLEDKVFSQVGVGTCFIRLFF